MTDNEKPCDCRCHAYGSRSQITCDRGNALPQGGWSCSPCTPPGEPCSHCGARGEERHQWREGDCLLGHNGHPRARVGHVCQGCVDRLRDWLTEITELYGTLGEVVEIGSVPDDTAAHGHVKKRPASPALVRLDAWAMLRDRDRLYRTGENSDLPDVPAVVADLAYRLHDELGTTPARDYGGSLTSSATYLSSRMDDLARSPWIDEADADLKWLRGKLRAAHGISAPKPLGACLTVVDGKDCGGKVMPSTDHDPRPRCGRCKRRYDHRDVARLAMMEARGGQAHAG